MEVKTLRIKKIYFDAIANGSKGIEYRATKPFYDWLSRIETPFLLRLHYQKRIFVSVTVKRVRLIRRPKDVDATLVPTDKVWALYLGEVVH